MNEMKWKFLILNEKTTDGLVDGRTESRGRLMIRPVGALAVEIHLNPMKLNLNPMKLMNLMVKWMKLINGLILNEKTKLFLFMLTSKLEMKLNGKIILIYYYP